MLGAVRHRILTQQRKRPYDFFSKQVIDGRHSQRCLPGAIRKNCQGSAAREMPRTEQNHPPGNIQAPVNLSGHTARIDISGVRNETAPRAKFLLFDATCKKGVDIRTQMIRIIWIKTAGDSWKANHSEPLKAWLEAANVMETASSKNSSESL